MILIDTEGEDVLSDVHISIGFRVSGFRVQGLGFRGLYRGLGFRV